MVNEEDSQANTSSMHNSRKKLLLLLLVFFLGIGLVWLVYWFSRGQYYETTDDAYVSGNLVQVMPQISGRVIAILAEQTDLVEKNQLLVQLDPADAYIALTKAETNLALTVRQVRQLYENVSQQQANLQLQQANLVKAQQDMQRRKALIVAKDISSEEMQHATVTFDAATASVEQAKIQLNAAISLVHNTDLYHHPQVQQAENNLHDAYLNWIRLKIDAPETGYIARRPVEIGQTVNPSTVLMVIVPLNQVWVDANFKESQIRYVRIGQPVKLVSDIYGEDVTYRGTVIGLNPGSGNVFDLLPPQNATGNWIKIVQRIPVRIAVDPKQLAEHPLKVGLSMTATIDTHDRTGQALTQMAQKKILYQAKQYTKELEEVDAIVAEILQNNSDNVSYPSKNLTP